MHIADLHKLDDEALGQVLAEAFADLPEAVPARLALVRDRLPLTPKAAGSNRWVQLLLIGILSGSGLAVAWWGVASFFHTEAETPQPTLHTPAAPATSLTPSATTEELGNNTEQTNQADDQHSPIIYQQERY